MYSVINVKNYDLIVGLDALNQSRDYLKDFIKSKAIIITDENVDRYHHKTLDILLDELKGLSDEKLQKSNYSRDEILQGLNDMCDMFGLEIFKG